VLLRVAGACADVMPIRSSRAGSYGSTRKRRRDVNPASGDTDKRRRSMWWGIGIGVVLWLILFIWLGLRTLRGGHGWMFFFGIFFPLLWVIGAFMAPAR